MRHPVSRALVLCAAILGASALGAEALAADRSGPVDESRLATLEGNTPAPAMRPENDRGVVADDMVLDHLLLTLRRPPAVEAALVRQIDAMHDPRSPEYHRWLTPAELGRRFGAAPADRDAVIGWVRSHGFTVNRLYQNGLIVDIAGTAGQIRAAFHTELHRLSLPNGETHIANISDPRIPAALAPAIEGVGPLHDFFPRSRAFIRGPVSYDRASGALTPHFEVSGRTTTYHAIAPYDFATIYNVLPLWKRGYSGQGVTIAVVEDSNLAHPADWATFRKTFGLDKFTRARFTQVYPNCASPGQNGDEIEAALDVEWASATAPAANIVLSACANGATTSGLDLAILNLLDTNPPDIISDSYGLCETLSGVAEVALENREAETATALGVTYFIAEGDLGADQCAPAEKTNYSTQGINGGDNTSSAYAVDVGGTDFKVLYNEDTAGIPVTNYWNDHNNPATLASARHYMPEMPWNDSCASVLIYTDPKTGRYPEAYGPNGFCNTRAGREFYDIAGGGGPSTCFTGKPSIPGVVSGTCKGNPKPAWQTGVPGIPDDGLRDQPDIAFFAATGVWGSFLVECLSDLQQGGTDCSATNDALLLGGGGTSFAAPAMAGIQALIDQKFGRQGNANTVLYTLARMQFRDQHRGGCDASRSTGALPNHACIFNDITVGDTAIPCGRGRDGAYFDCYGADHPYLGVLSLSDTKLRPAYPAGAGYDQATGLGSINAENLFDAWPPGR